VDRDGFSSVAPTMPPIYRMWAKRFNRAGFATFRYDKRFLTHPDVDIPSFDQEDQIADAMSALKFLRSTPGVDKTRVFVLGHSEGGTLAPIVAERSDEVAGVIVINAVVFSVEDLLLAQVKSNPMAMQTTRSEVKRWLSQIRDGSFPPGGVLFGAGGGYWRQWIEYSSKAGSRLTRLSMPMLLVQCMSDGKFPESTLQRNLEVLRTVASRNPRAQLRELAGLDHLGFVVGRGEPAEVFMNTLIVWLNNTAHAAQQGAAADGQPATRFARS